jgi:hypothetical protein
VPTLVRVHPAGWLIQKDHLAPAAESNGAGKGAFLASRKCRDALMLLVFQVNVLDIGVDLGTSRRLAQAFEAREKDDVLGDRESVKEDVMLRAQPKRVADALYVRDNITAVDRSAPARRWVEAAKDGLRGCVGHKRE